MNYRERMREYLKEPDEYSSQYGKWGALNREQRQMITRLLNEMDRADEYIKHQFFEIERLQDMDKILRNENLKLKLIIATAIRIYEDCAETQDYSTCDLDMYEVLKGVLDDQARERDKKITRI